MQELVAGRDTWQGKVKALMINQNVAEVGVPMCSDATSLPVVQDNADGAMWTTLGAIYNSYLVFDKSGKLVASFLGLTLPGVAEELADAVDEALK